MEDNFLCRLCALKSDNFINVFDVKVEHLKIVDKIKLCLQIWLTPEDTLPKIVCLNCCEKIEDFYEFHNNCTRSQTSLMNIFNNKTDNAVLINDEDDDDEEEWTQELTEENTKESPAEAEVSPPKDGDPLSDKGAIANATGRKLRSPQKLSYQDGDDDNEFIENDGDNESDSLNKDQEKLNSSSDDQEDVFNDKPAAGKKLFECYIWECSECELELFSLSSFKSHYLEVHNRPPLYKCMLCRKVYERYRSFSRHVKLHGDTKQFSCDICGKRFSQKTVLQSHSAVHSEERPHVCSQCGKAFKQFSSLYLHSKCHLPDQAKPKFTCSLCNKVFSTKHNLNTHTKIHTGERNFICDICGTSFISKGSLDYHILSHNEAKPHPCDVCGKSFKTARVLAKHSSVHTGIKPHQCDVCGKQFRERSALKEHNRIHTGAMPYKCDFCGKLFRFKGILTIHKRQHTGERPYSCEECRREFTNWANYNKHMKRRHKNEEQPNIERSQPSQVSNSHTVESLAMVPELSETDFREPNPSIYKALTDSDVYRDSRFCNQLQMGTMPYYVYPIASMSTTLTHCDN